MPHLGTGLVRDPNLGWASGGGWRRYNRVGFEVISRIVLLLGMAASLGQAAEPDTVTYSRRQWLRADGLPEDFAQGLAQRGDGFLWFGTRGGLGRSEASALRSLTARI